ncbi:MAG: type IV pilus twitching motility protein PilT [Candidatus Sumerlaeia bacterium]
MNIHKIVEAAMKTGASDIYFVQGDAPYFRVDDHIKHLQHDPLTQENMEAVMETFIPDYLRAKLDKIRGVDAGYTFDNMVRCRAIAFYERQKLQVVVRLIPLKPLSIEQLELPPVLHDIARLRNGLVLVTGPTGSGKSTTMAAMIDLINENHHKCITTIENPIEYVHQNKKSIIFQRDVGDDVPDFNTGLIQSLRQAPDIILLGEMRDLETMRTSIRAAEIGHLVMSTLHTVSAVQTIQRIVSVYPETEHDLVREQLSHSLKAVITQDLVRRIEGKGRIAACEIMVVNAPIRKLIYENQIDDIYEVIRRKDDGMRTFDQDLARLTSLERITKEEAEAHSADAWAYRRFLKGVASSSDSGGIISSFE